MRIEPAISARLEFAKRAAVSREFTQRLEQETRRQEKSRDKDRAEDRAEMDLLELAQMVVMATDSEMAQFEWKLDSYDAATIEALMENERELQIVQERLEERLEQAIVLPDGRRVFKTEDGMRVMDEFGDEVSPDILSADEIPDHKDRFEPYWRDHTTRVELVREREDLFEYQGKLDRSRERYQQARDENEGGAVSRDFLDELDAEIDAATPDRVKRILGQDVPEANAEFSFQQDVSRPIVQPVSKLDIPAP